MKKTFKATVTLLIIATISAVFMIETGWNVFASQRISSENMDNSSDAHEAQAVLDATEEISDISDIRENIEVIDGEITSTTECGEITIIDDELNGIIVESEESPNFSMSLKEIEDSDPVVLDDSIIFNDDEFSVVTEIGEGEIRNSFVIDNYESPERFEVEYDFDANIRLDYARDDEGNTDGSIVAVDPEGNALIAIDIPYAYDAEGKAVETYYEIEDNTIIQVVRHKNANVSYPIVADPSTKFGIWFKKGKWMMNGKKRALELIPTASLRAAGASVYLTKVGRVASLAFIETSWSSIYKKYGKSKHWKNTKGMKDQYICHYYFAFYKTAFHLEPSRKNVGLVKTIAAKCNP